MSLVRAWTRALSGASAAALLVPGGIFAALLVLAFAGSFGQLGRLSQAFAGPAPPAAVQPAAAATASGRTALLPVVTASARVSGTAARSTSAGAGAAVLGNGIGNGSTPATSTGPSSPGRAISPTGPTGPPTGTRPPCASACNPPPPQRPTVIDQVVSLGSSITSTVPGPAGQLASQALKQVGAAVDQVLPKSGSGGFDATVGELGRVVSKLQ